MLDNPQFPQMASQPPARTAYDIRYEATMSPFTRAKYGLGRGPATSVTQLTTPRMASGAAAPISPQLSQFSPSGSSISLPRINPAQFGSQ